MIIYVQVSTVQQCAKHNAHVHSYREEPTIKGHFGGPAIHRRNEANNGVL